MTDFVCLKNHATIWNGKKIVAYEVSPDKAMVRAEGERVLRRFRLET